VLPGCATRWWCAASAGTAVVVIMVVAALSLRRADRGRKRRGQLRR
jgi:hypothetical protein